MAILLIFFHLIDFFFGSRDKKILIMMVIYINQYFKVQTFRWILHKYIKNKKNTRDIQLIVPS